MGRTGDVYVDWEVATGLSSDGKLDNIVLSSLQSTQNGTVAKQNPAVAYAAQAHSVHLEVGLDTAKLPTTPERTYYCRFTVSDSTGKPKCDNMGKVAASTGNYDWGPHLITAISENDGNND